MINFFDGILILCNFFIFIGIQTVFLILVTESRLLKEMDYLIYFYKPWINEIRNIHPDFIKKKKMSEEKPDNSELLMKTIGIPLGVILILIIILAILGVIFKNKWGSHHTIGLFLILLAYVTEIMVYFLVANEYRYLNSSSIIFNFITKLKERINEYPNNYKNHTLLKDFMNKTLNSIKYSKLTNN